MRRGGKLVKRKGSAVLLADQEFTGSELERYDANITPSDVAFQPPRSSTEYRFAIKE